MALTEEELQRIGKHIFDELDKRKSTGPRRIDRNDSAEISRSLKDIASGKAVLCDMSEPRKKRKLAAHEVDREDQKAISENLAAIASGEKVLVDAYE